MMKRPGLKIALGLCLLLAAAVFGAVSAGQLLGGVVNIEKNDFTSNELAPTQQQDVAYPIAQAACPMRLDPSEIEGETLFCGTVTVPQNYEEPDGKQIELAFALLKSTSLSPATDPVIYLHGGPGAAELRSLAELSERLASLRQTRDIVVFDQRGTGYSNEPVACDVEYVTQQDEVRDLISSYAQNASINEEFAVNMAMFKLCLDRLEDSDVDLTQYNTFNNARDVTSVAAALGYEDFNLYGFSYGTQLALEVMRQHPQKLRSVILDSVAPADLKLYENFGQPNIEAVTSLFDLCAQDAECNAAYPDLENRFKTLLTQLDEQPISGEDGTVVTSKDVIAALRQSDIRPGLGDYIPLMIWELEQGKLDTLLAINSNELPLVSQALFIDPLTLQYVDQELSPDAEFLVESALRLRQQARELNETADRFLVRGDEEIALTAAQATPAGRFDYLFHKLVKEEPFDRHLAINQSYLALPLEERTVDTVRTFVSENFQGVSANRLMDQVGRMSDEDVEELASIIFGKARDHPTYFNVAMALSLYVCQEHLPFNTIEDALDEFAALGIPQLTGGKRQTVLNLMTSCQLFPTGQAPEGFHDAVESDIPTLILLGTADTQTAISWGRHVAENLENGRSILFPETGHGAIRYSQCARDIGAAFFNDPEAEINTVCTEDLLPVFELPPDTDQ